MAGDHIVLNVGALSTDGEKMKFLTFKIFQLWWNISLPVSLSELASIFANFLKWLL